MDGSIEGVGPSCPSTGLDSTSCRMVCVCVRYVERMYVCAFVVLNTYWRWCEGVVCVCVVCASCRWAGAVSIVRVFMYSSSRDSTNDVTRRETDASGAWGRSFART